MRVIVLMLILQTVALAAPKPGDEGTPEYRTAADLVRQLGDPKFAVREAAGKQLVEMGAAAVPALTGGTKSADEEVRTRSVALLPKAEAVGWGRRADAFLADPTGRHDLPLQAAWEKLTGKPDAGSRKLFADVIRACGPLLEVAANDQKAAPAALAAKSKGLLESVRAKGTQVEVEAGAVAAVLFVQLVLKSESDTGRDRHAPLYLLANPTVATALGVKDTGPAFRRLVVAWAESRPGGETMTALYFSLLTHRKPFAESVPYLIRLATKHESAQVRWAALEALGRSGTEVADAKLTELLADTTAMYKDLGGDDARQEVRDCALAALVNGKGKDPSAYGLTSYMSANFWFGGTADGITLHLHGFKSAADRERGFKKWRAEAASKK